MTQTIKEQILAIRDTGLTNMFDLPMVQRLAYDRDFFELVTFIEENRKEYVDEIAAIFILQGYLDYLSNHPEELKKDEKQ